MKRLLPFIVLILVILGGIISVPFLLRPESHRAEITDTLSKLLKHPVVIGPITMTYWPPTLRLAQVAVMKEAATPALEIESIEAPLDWASLFRLRLVPSELRLTHPVLTAQRRPDGSWDLADWFAGAAGFSNAGAWPVQKVSWTAGDIHAVDRYAVVSQEIFLTGLEGNWIPKQDTLTTNGGFSGIGAPARLSWSAKGQFFSSPQYSGDLQLTGEGNTTSFHIEGHAAALDMKGGAGQWKLAGVVALAKFYIRGRAVPIGPSGTTLLENWQLHIHREGDHLDFEHSAIVSGGLSEIKGSVDHRVLHTDIALKDIPAEAVWSVVDEEIPLSGKVTGLAKDVEMALSTQSAISLQGQGYWELRGGRYKLPDASLKKLARAKTMAYMKKKFPDLETQGIPVDKLSAHWQAKAGFVSVEDGLLIFSDQKVGWVGKIDIVRRGFDGFVRLQLHEKDPKLARAIPAKYLRQPAFGHVQGAWDEWSLRSVPASKIPAKTQSQLRKAVQ